jgi:formylglycine-generating enzyme required for sulfatase activity
MKRMLAGLLAVGCSLAVHAAPDVYHNGLGMPFVQIPPGRFIMGTLDLGEVADELRVERPMNISDELPPHEVVISRPFWLGQTEVTQGQWFAVMGTRPGTDWFWEEPDWEVLPVTGVSWDDVQAFIERLNAEDPEARYRLPTEAEWEHAARAGSKATRPFPRDELDEHAWYIENSGDRPQPVATRQVNAWGLYDMLGNVWEWVADHYSPTYYKVSPAMDPKGPGEGEKRVRRGGSYHCNPELVRPAYRAPIRPERGYSVLGFRLVAEPK